MGGCVSSARKPPAEAEAPQPVARNAVAPAPAKEAAKDESKPAKDESKPAGDAAEAKTGEDGETKAADKPPPPTLLADAKGLEVSGSVPVIEVGETGGDAEPASPSKPPVPTDPSTPQLVVPTGGLARLPSFSRIPVLVVGSDDAIEKERQTRNKMAQLDRDLSNLQQLREADRRILTMLSRTKRSLERDLAELRSAMDIVAEIEDMRTMEEVLRSSFKKLNSFEKTREEMEVSIKEQLKQQSELMERFEAHKKDFQAEVDGTEQEIAMIGAQMPEIAERKKEHKKGLEAFGDNPRATAEGKSALKKLQAVESEMREKEDKMVAAVGYTTFVRTQIERLEKHHIVELKIVMDAYPSVVEDLEPLQSIDLAVRPQLNELYTTIRDKRRAAQNEAKETSNSAIDLPRLEGEPRGSLSASMPVFVVGGEEETEKERAATGAVHKLQSELDALRTLDDTDSRTLNMIARCKRTLERDLADLERYQREGLDSITVSVAPAEDDPDWKQRADKSVTAEDTVYDTFRSARMKFISFCKMMAEIRTDQVEGGQNKSALMDKIKLTRASLEQEVVELSDRMSASKQKIEQLQEAKKVREDEIANEPSLTEEEQKIARQEIETPLAMEEAELSACENHHGVLETQLHVIETQLEPQLTHSQSRDEDCKDLINKYTELETTYKDKLTELMPGVSKIRELSDQDKDLTAADTEEDKHYMAKLKHLLAIDKGAPNTTISEEKMEERNLFASGEWKNDEAMPVPPKPVDGDDAAKDQAKEEE